MIRLWLLAVASVAILCTVVPWWAAASQLIPLLAFTWSRRKRRRFLNRTDRLYSPELRAALLARGGGVCAYCHRAVHYESDCPRGGCDLDYQADHLVAWADGGRTTLDNGVVACRWCNLHKSARPVGDFLDDPDGDGLPGMDAG